MNRRCVSSNNLPIKTADRKLAVIAIDKLSPKLARVLKLRRECDAEGEAVAHPRRQPVIEWLDGKTAEVRRGAAEENPELPDGRDAAVTAAWIVEVLGGKRGMPAAITHQTGCCTREVLT